MNKKILVFAMSEGQSKYEVGRVIEEAKKQGIEAERALYKDLSFDLNGERSGVFLKDEELSGESVLGMFFRVAGTSSGKYVFAKCMLIRILRKEVFCVNEESYLKWQRMGKMLQHSVFVDENIPVVPTKIFYTMDQILKSKIGTELGWPLIAKHERGFQGKSVVKINDKKEMENFVKKVDDKNLGMFLWQKYLPTRWDLRVIVMDGKVLGAMKRSAVGEEFRSNFSLGGDVDRWKLSKEDENLAVKVAKVCELDYCGVDIMKDEAGNSYVLEVNRQCQFQGFEKATGINVAKAVVEMMVKR